MSFLRTTILKYSLALWLAKQTRGSLFMTAPVASTTCYGGMPCVLSWIDDQADPPLSTYGPTNIALYTGTPTQQTQVYELTTLDPGTTDDITVIIPATVAANGTEYFIRMQPIKPSGANLTTYQAFSAHFKLLGMTGVTPKHGARTLRTAGSIPDGNSTNTHNGTISPTVTSSMSPGSGIVPMRPHSRLAVVAMNAKPQTSSASAESSNSHGSTMFYILKISQIGGIIMAFELLKYSVL